MRLFCAVDTDPALHALLAQAIETLRRSDPDAKWTTSPQWHVTLKFLGEVGTLALPEILDLLSREAAAAAPAPLRLNGVGVFGGLKPRIVLAKVEDPAGILAQLAGVLDRGLRPLGFHPDNHLFSAHVTLARTRSDRNARALLEEIRGAQGILRGDWTAREVVLYQSILKPGGAEYSAILRAPLGPGKLPDNRNPRRAAVRGDLRR
ncbi:MAG: RNA 2',3'-cyclic phosphodiesterase [Planctomycetota bacterium]